MTALLNDVDRELVERVRHCVDAAEHEHKQFRDHGARMYSRYRGWKSWEREKGVARDVDTFHRKAVYDWGADFHIPYGFRTVETIVPRMLAHRPKIVPKPRDPEAFGSVDNMRLIIEMQQEQIAYELILQDICKDGLIYGLGVQGVGWANEEIEFRGIAQGTYGNWVQETRTVPRWDDPYAEWVDPFNFLWAAHGHNIQTLPYVIKRVYRDDAYVTKMVERKAWRSGEWDPACTWKLEDMLSTGPTTREESIQSDRRAAEGYNAHNPVHGKRHEVWEYHTGRELITILNAEFPVLVDEGPMPDGSIPFQIFRPTVVPGRIVGIGEIEPIQDLIDEMDTLRGQRRDAATMRLNAGYFFDESIVNQDDLQIGPNIGVPVNGSPREAIMPMQIADVPSTAYQDSAEIARDIEGTSGIADQVAGGDGAASQTATGAQLVQQAASLRIQNKTKLLGQQIIVPTGEAWVLLNQTRIVASRDIPVATADPLNPWQAIQVGPGELQGRMAITIDDGSTMAENVPQMRQDAQAWMALIGNPLFDQAKVAEKILENYGVKNTRGWVITEPQVPAGVIEQALGVLGVPPEAFTAAMDQVEAAQQDLQAQEAPGGV